MKRRAGSGNAARAAHQARLQEAQPKRLVFQSTDHTPQGVDRIHLSDEYMVSVTEYVWPMAQGGVVTRMVIHGRKQGARLRVEDAQIIKKVILGDVEGVLVFPCDARERDLILPGALMLWCLSPGEVYPMGPQGALPAGMLGPMLRVREVAPKELRLLDAPEGEADFVAGETEGWEKARVLLGPFPVLDVQRARSGEDGWVEVSLRRDPATGRLRCLPLAAAALQAPAEGETFRHAEGRLEVLHAAEGYATRILGGKVRVVWPEAPPNQPGGQSAGAPADPPGGAPPADLDPEE